MTIDFFLSSRITDDTKVNENVGMILFLNVNFEKLSQPIRDVTKGQIKSEWIYEIINFPKNDTKN